MAVLAKKTQKRGCRPSFGVFRPNLVNVSGRGLTLGFDLYILIVKICARHK